MAELATGCWQLTLYSTLSFPATAELVPSQAHGVSAWWWIGTIFLDKGDKELVGKPQLAMQICAAPFGLGEFSVSMGGTADWTGWFSTNTPWLV